MYVPMCVCLCVCACVCMHACMHVIMYVCMYVTYVYICIYIYNLYTYLFMCVRMTLYVYIGASSFSTYIHTCGKPLKMSTLALRDLVQDPRRLDIRQGRNLYMPRADILEPNVASPISRDLSLAILALAHPEWAEWTLEP